MTLTSMNHGGLISRDVPVDNMRTRRIRAHLAKRLKVCGSKNPQSFRQLLDYCNTTTRHGTTAAQLSNVLAKNPEFKQVGLVKAAGMVSGGYEITVWTLKEVGEDED